MLRPLARALVVAGAIASLGSPARGAERDLERARVLDQQGVRAYKEDRYNDAIRYFREAWRLGGPPTELWNIAKCHARLDEPEKQANALEEYLAQPNLSPGDRGEATQQLQELRHRRSTVTVASSPAGGTVFVDGRRNAPAGTTPVSFDVPPGSHTIVVERAGYAPYSRAIDASYGRAVIVDAQLVKNDAAPAAKRDAGGLTPHRLILDAQLAAMFPRFGSVGGGAQAGALLGAAWVLRDSGFNVLAIGARGSLTSDAWSNMIGDATVGPGCGGPLSGKESATALSAFVEGSLGWRLSPSLRAGGEAGLGIATLSADQVGGDVFTPTCRASPGVKPALFVAAQVSWALSRELRIVATPLFVEAQPAFDGARAAPRDASGAWLTFGLGLGLAFDVF